MLAIRTAQCSRGITTSLRNAIRTIVSGGEQSKFASSFSPISGLHRNVPLAGLSCTVPWSAHSLQQRWYSDKPTTKEEQKAYDLTGWERVYYGSLTPRMRAVKVFSLTTSITGLAAQPLLLDKGMELGGTGMAVFLCTFAGFFTFVTPFLLHFITKKYVTELHYNPNSGDYVATTISLFLYKIHTKFRPSEVKVPDVPGMFTSFVVRGRTPFFVDPVLFEDPEHYVKIMGYDKPIDFKLNLKELEDSAAPEATTTTTASKTTTKEMK